MSLSEAHQYLAEDHFDAGSMRPKVEAAIDFIENSSAVEPQVIIGCLDKLTGILNGTSGTRIMR